MKFTTENDALSSALAVLRSYMPKMTTIPIMQHVAIEAKSGSVSMRANSFDREAEATIVAQTGTDGSAAVPGEILVGIASRLAEGGQAAFELVGDRVVITSGKSRFELRSLPIDAFPNRKALDGTVVTFVVPAAPLRTLFSGVDYATLSKSPKAYHGGVYLHVVKGKLIAVASDDHRFALQSTAMPVGAEAMPGVIIPSDAVSGLGAALKRAGDESVELSVSPNLLELRLDDLRIATLLVGATFPDYTRIVPKPNGASVGVRSGDLAEAAERVSVVYMKSKLGDRVALIEMQSKDGVLALRAGFKGAEIGSEEIEADADAEHKLNCSVKVEYLMDALKAWPDDTQLSLQQANKDAPVLFWSEAHPDMMHLVAQSR